MEKKKYFSRAGNIKADHKFLKLKKLKRKEKSWDSTLFFKYLLINITFSQLSFPSRINT